MSRIKVLKLAAGAAAIAAGAGLVYQAIESKRDRRRHRPPGRLIGKEGAKLHLHDAGFGSPVVILEAGIAASSVSWQPVQKQVAEFTRVVSYDRAGLGWSDAASGPRSLRAIVSELRSALAAQDVPSPYVLVGHSFGGLVVRAFAAWHPEEVAGLVLVDPVLPADWIDISRSKRLMLGYGVMLSKRGAWLAKLGVVRLALKMLTGGARSIPQAIATASSGPGAAVIGRMIGQVRKLPQELWPVIQAQWCDPKSFRGMAGYLECLPRSATEVSRFAIEREIPVTVLSASDATAQQKREWDRIGKHVESARGGHWLQLDDPELVVAAIREHVTDAVRDWARG